MRLLLMLLWTPPLLLAEWKGPKNSPEEVVTLWRALPKLAKEIPDRDYRDLPTWLPNRGLRGLYGKARVVMNLAQLETISGHKIFRAGPHRDGKLDLKAKTDFGHYNPAFLKWAQQHAIPGRHNARLRKELQPVYDQLMQRTARHFYRTHKLLQSVPERAAKARDGYTEQLAAEGNAGFWLQEFFFADAAKADRAGHDWAETNVSLGFWVRRDLDGTSKEFHRLLTVLLETHDAEWLKEQK